MGGSLRERIGKAIPHVCVWSLRDFSIFLPDTISAANKSSKYSSGDGIMIETEYSY
jgi:hypothetical protein